MVSKQTIKILIEAEDNVTKAAKKAESALNKLGNVGSKAMNAINSASSRMQGALNKLGTYITKAREKFNQFANSSNKLGTIKSAISNAANSFGELISNGNAAKTVMEQFKSVSDGLQSKFTSLSAKIKSFGSSVKTSLKGAFSFQGVKAKFDKLGTSIDKLKAKLKSLTTSSKGLNNSFGFLRNAASMTVGMLGYDLVNSIVQTTKESMNARSSIQSFGSRLKMSGSEVSSFQKSLDELQHTYKKIDMDVVGQQATDMAYRLGLPKTSLTELTETTAIFTDAMQRNGRSAEDSMLAMSDAMDGEFRRLKEIGISQEDLMNNGWNGDINDKTSLLTAMNKALKEQHYDVLAQGVDNLDDAWNVLNITLSNLIESILVPLTPILAKVIMGFADVVDGIISFVGMLQSAWAGLPDWAQMAIEIAAIAIAVGVVVGSFGGIIGMIETVGVAIIGFVGPIIAAITSISLPVVAVVAAIGLLVAAVYEVGKAFGWWSDAGSMIQAIGSGIMRLWNAFINHPDVQGLISDITNVIKTLASYITIAGQYVLEFFGVSTSSNWDVVSSIINGIGIAWSIISGPIKTAVMVVKAAFSVFGSLVGIAVGIGQGIYNALKPIVCILLGCSPGIVPALSKVSEVFTTVWNYLTGFLSGVLGSVVTSFQPVIDILTQIASFLSGAFTSAWNFIVFAITTVITTVRAVINVFQLFLNGQISLPQAILTILTLLYSAYQKIFTKIMNAVIKFAAKMLSKAKTMAKNFVNGIINNLKQLPGKAYSALLAVVSRIVSAGGKWVSSVKTQAQKVVNGAYNTLSKIAGKIRGALSGVKNAITKPFQQAYDYVKPIYDKIKSMVSAIPGLAAGYDYLEGQNADGSWNTIGKTSTSTTTNNTLTGEITIIHDLKDVPASIDETTLANLINTSASDETFGKLIAENRGFQTYDLKVKSVLKNRNSRARGI